MPLEYTPAVARALEAAQARAHHLGSPSVEPEHLLFALLLDDEARPAVLLAATGVDLPALRQALGPDPGGEAPPAPLPNSRRSRDVLAGARELATALSPDRCVPSEALLLALVQEDEASRRLLEGHGLDYGRLEEKLLGSKGPPLEMDVPLQLSEPVEEVNTARILDASANRAREALRVLEDYCRFALDDALLTREFKQLRHDLAAALETLPPALLLHGRDTPGDVGTTLSTEREQERYSLLAVAQANGKRLQEALRSLEEYGKLFGPGGWGGLAPPIPLGTALEALRYRSYTLERALVLGSTARQRLDDARLYVLVTASLCRAGLEWTVKEAAAGGADVIQLREKDLDDRQLLERARQVRRWTRDAGVVFILNDRPDLARLAEADGVHLGQEDLTVRDARRVVGPDALIGVSTHDLRQLRQAVLDGANYLGFGPTFPSGTKQFAELAGLEFVRQAVAETSLPAFVLGGINRDTIGQAVGAGARRVAVSQAICQAEDPRRAAAELRRALP